MESNGTQSSSNAHTNGAAARAGAKKQYTLDTKTASPSHTDDLSSTTSPPYWTHSHSRSVSNISVESVSAGGITLQDNTDDDGGNADPKNKACWARSVYIEDYVKINGSRTGIGAFIVWNITVEIMGGSPMRIRKRYSEFDDLRENLLQTFPRSTAAMPSLPPKSVISKYRSKFLENRRAGLQYFLNCILLNPEFSGSPVLKEFLFSRD